MLLVLHVWVDGNASDSLKNSTVYFDDVELIGGDSEEDSNYRYFNGLMILMNRN